MAEPLKPCPFCGSTAAISPDGDGSLAWIWCSNCEASGPMVRPADGRDCVEDHEMPELERRAWIAWNRRALSLAQIKSLIALGLIYSEKQGHLWVVGGDVGAWLWPNGTTADLRGTARCVLCEERWPLVGDLAPMPECPRKADAEAAKIDGAAAGAS